MVLGFINVLRNLGAKVPEKFEKLSENGPSGDLENNSVGRVTRKKMRVLTGEVRFFVSFLFSVHPLTKEKNRERFKKLFCRLRAVVPT